MPYDKDSHFQKLPPSQLESIMRDRYNEIRGWGDKVAYGVTPPDHDLVSILSPFIEKNPNNIGIHRGRVEDLRGTRRMEHEVVQALACLSGCDDAEGWLTSGGSEGNLTGLWLGRQYLYERGSQKIGLVTSELRHESIDKASNILGFRGPHLVQTDSDGRMDARGVTKAIRGLIKKNRVDGVLVAATVGASQTGTCDLVASIGKALRDSSDVSSYLHVDAAFGGLVLPFSAPERKFGLHVPEVMSLTIDPGKMGGAPLGIGAFICRLGLSHLIQFDGRLGPAENVTLHGSRSGVAAAASWYSLFSKGREGFASVVEYCLDLKQLFLECINRLDFPVDVVHDPDINVVAFRIRRNAECRIDDDVAHRYRLTVNSLPSIFSGDLYPPIAYTVKFMPHLTSESVYRLVSAIAG